MKNDLIKQKLLQHRFSKGKPIKSFKWLEACLRLSFRENQINELDEDIIKEDLDEDEGIDGEMIEEFEDAIEA